LGQAGGEGDAASLDAPSAGGAAAGGVCGARLPLERLARAWNGGAADLRAESETRQGFEAMAANFEKGWMGPVALHLSTKGDLWDGASQEAVAAMAAELAKDPRVAMVLGYPEILEAFSRFGIRADADLIPEGAQQTAASAVVRRDGRAALVLVVPHEAPEAASTMQFVRELRGRQWKGLNAAGIQVGVTGYTAAMADFDHELFGSLWKVVPAVLALTFLLLMLLFRSLLIPLKATLMNLLSVLGAYGFLVLVFQEGHGASWIGLSPPGGLNSFIVLMLFTILFGLSMDYEVFLLGRIREEYLQGASSQAAVASGLGRSGGIITSAALIMVCLFGSFGFTRLTATREFGLGLAFAVALDASLIRVILVPALMELFGKGNWWLPRWLDRILPRIG
jgi:RND superfamily putative drug exporter